MVGGSGASNRCLRITRGGVVVVLHTDQSQRALICLSAVRSNSATVNDRQQTTVAIYILSASS